MLLPLQTYEKKIAEFPFLFMFIIPWCVNTRVLELSPFFFSNDNFYNVVISKITNVTCWHTIYIGSCFATAGKKTVALFGFQLVNSQCGKIRSLIQRRCLSLSLTHLFQFLSALSIKFNIYFKVLSWWLKGPVKEFPFLLSLQFLDLTKEL